MKDQINSNSFYKLNLNSLRIEISEKAPFYEELADIFNYERINENGKIDRILPSHATYVVPERKVHFLSFRPKGKIENVNINNTLRFFATLEMTVLLSFRSGTT